MVAVLDVAHALAELHDSASSPAPVSIVVFSLLTSLVQLIAPNEMRGRVMSIYMVAFRGGSPLGSLLSGYLASLSSAPLVLAANGAALVLVGIYFLTRRHTLKAL